MRTGVLFKAVCLMILAVLTLSMIGCLPEKPIRIAVMTKLDSGSIVGISEIDGARFFLEQNRIRNIDIVPFDDGWDPDRIKPVYEQIRAQGIDIIITSHTSTCALVLKALTDAEPGKVLVFDTGSTTDKLSNQQDFTLRAVIDVEKEQKYIAAYMREKGFENPVIIRDTDNPGYTEPGLRYFQQYYGNDPQVIELSIRSIDFKGLEQRLRASGFKSVYLLVGGYQTNAGAVAQLARTLEPECPIMYTPWMKTPTILETAGKSINGSVMPSHYPPRGTDPGVDGYIDAFKARYGYSPTFISLNVYRAIEILNQMFEKGQRTPEAIQGYILKNPKFNTSFGEFEFNRYGDTEMPLYFIHDISREF